PVYEKGLQELLGKENSDKLISQMNLYGSFKKFPPELEKPIFFTDVKLKWNQDLRAYQSTNGKLSIGNILKSQLNVELTGHFEIVKKRSGDILTFYFELDPNNWYFFRYQRNLMQVLSSNKEFNQVVKDVKSDKRKIKYDKGKVYSFILSTPKRKADFLKRFN
ncbi:MAG: hypothetical protein MRY83_20285, partial [Flavobacteriales bacterium]|nr:hypothetical protein [Flavobacteriales bacterium]